MKTRRKKITVIGGGTGTFVVLSGLKDSPFDIGAVVAMTDSGGSSGRLRDQLGVLPPGDLRQCLVALSGASLLWRRLFLYRFQKGDLKGHNFGNIFLSALEKVSDNYQQVIDNASQALQVKGKVIPATIRKAQLCVEYENGKFLQGEGKIDDNSKEKSGIKNIFLKPKVEASARALERLKKSDYIIIGPGDLYTSILPVILTGGTGKVIETTRAKIIYIMNLMTKAGQTTNYTAQDHLKILFNKYLNRYPDYVIINNGTIPKSILEWYLSHQERVVSDDLDSFSEREKRTVVVRKDLVYKTKIIKNKADKLTRSIVRHDPLKLAVVIKAIVNH